MSGPSDTGAGSESPGWICTWLLVSKLCLLMGSDILEGGEEAGLYICRSESLFADQIQKNQGSSKKQNINKNMNLFLT